MNNTISEVFKVDKSFVAILAKFLGKKKVKFLMGAKITIAYLGGEGYIIEVKDA